MPNIQKQTYVENKTKFFKYGKPISRYGLVIEALSLNWNFLTR